jgi:hypothetical protein
MGVLTVSLPSLRKIHFLSANHSETRVVTVVCNLLCCHNAGRSIKLLENSERALVASAPVYLQD